MMTTEKPLKGVSTAAGPSVHSTEEEVSGVSSLSNRRFRALYLYFCLQESRAQAQCKCTYGQCATYR